MPTLERIAQIADEHARDAAAASQWGTPRPGRTLYGPEHEEIAELARMYLSAIQRENFRRIDFARSAMQGLVAGMSSDPMSVISGPQIAATAVDMADCLMEALARPAVPL